MPTDTPPAGSPPSASSGGFTVLFRSQGLSALHMLQLVALGFCVAGIGLSWHLSQAPATAVTSSQARSGWSLMLAALAVTAPVGAWAYGRRLVSEVRINQAGDTLRLRDSNLFAARWHTLARADIEVAAWAAGDTAGEQALAPPRVVVAVKGGGSFVVPLGGRAQGSRELLQALRG